MFKNEQIMFDFLSNVRYTKVVQKRTMQEAEYAEESDRTL